MSKVNFNTSSLSSPTEYVLNISDMRGVDLTNTPLFVKPYRASSMSNFTRENNINQSRYGWSEVLQLENKINGVWEFDTSRQLDNGNYEVVRHFIVMSGKEFYEVFGLLTENITYKKIVFDERVNINRLIDNVSYGVVGIERLYIFCGDFVVLKYFYENGELKAIITKVEDDKDTYIPTTTISIACKQNTKINRVSLDDVNMLSSWRFNRLLGETVESIETNGIMEFKYRLDNVCTNLDTIIVTKETIGEPLELVKGVDFTVENITESNTEFTQITMTKNIPPLIEGQDNIYVKFERIVAGLADRINNAKIGILYGFDNIKDRLFVSGNPVFPNMVWHSTETNTTDEQDFTYFSDLDYSRLGNTTNEVKGFSILGDGTLAILKTPSGQEPSIYLMKPKMLSTTDESKIVIYKEFYETMVGTIGEGLINTSSLLNLCGDTLMLSNNGVYGIELSENVASSQRYAKARSRLINGELLKRDINKAVCTVFSNKYYICIEDRCYVADATQKYQLEDDLTDTFQYEWYVWDNIPARIFFVINNELYFGTNEGHICNLEKKNTKDTTYSDIKAGELTYDFSTNLFVISKDRVEDLEKLHDNDIMYIRSNDKDIYALFLDKGEFTIKNGQIQVLSFMHEDQIVSAYLYDIFIDQIEDSTTTLQANVVYKATLDGDNKIALYVKDADSTRLENLGYGNYRICYRLPNNNVIYDVQTAPDVDGTIIKYSEIEYEDGKWVRYNEEGNIVESYEIKPLFTRFRIRQFISELKPHKIVKYDNQPLINLSARFEFSERIQCYYITPVFNMDNHVYSKNLKQVTITPDTMLGTQVDFGYETKKSMRMFSAYTGKSFSFDNLDFDNLNFETEGFAKDYVKKCREKNFNYIRFIFKNNGDSVCKINNLNVVYTLGKKNKGVS